MIASGVIASPRIPHLWAADLGTVVSLSNRFAVSDLLNIPSNIEPGLHIILVDSETSEAVVRQGIYKILACGNIPEIYHAQQPIELLAADQSLSAGELALQIVEFSQQWDKWLEARSQNKITLKVACEIAQVVITYLSGQQRLVELGTLRVRCNQSSYDWNKLMGKLEKELLEELQKRGLAVEVGQKPDDQCVGTIKQEYQNLLATGASATAIESFKINVRQQFPLLQPSEINKLLDAIADEFLSQQTEADEADEVAKLVAATEQTINIADYLPPTLANPLVQYCQWQKLRQGVVITSFLTAASSLHKVGTELIIQKNQDFRVPPTLFSAIVAESGAKKSPIFRATAREPLNILKTLDQEVYKTNLELYQSELEAWEQAKASLPKGERMSEPKPHEPKKPPIYYFTDATGEGIKAQAANQPEKTLLGLVDELAGFFNSSNQYRGGRGSDKQDLLSYFDGSGVTSLRASGVKVDVNKIYLSILGTIQPEVLRSAMGNTNDIDGSWARFLYAIQPNEPSTLAFEQDVVVDMKDLLAYFLRKIHELPATQYRLSFEAFKAYQPFYNRLEQLRVSHPSSGMRAVYSKAEGITGRLALNLHILHELARDLTPSVEIPLERIKEAMSLMKFYIGQTKLIYASVDDQSTAPQILKMIELSKRKQLGGETGWIKAKDIQINCTKTQRPTANDARDWMNQAAASGYGETRGSGIRLEFKAVFLEKVGENRRLVDENRRLVDDVSTQEKAAISSFGPTLTEKVDAFDDYIQPAPTFTTDLQLEVGKQKVDDYLQSAPTFAQNPSIPMIIAVDESPTFASTESPTFSDEVQGASAAVEAMPQQQGNARVFEPEITQPFDFATTPGVPWEQAEMLGTSQAKPKTVAKGATVRFKCVGSTRDGLTATVRYVKANGECNIQFHDQTLPAHLLTHLCLVSMVEVISGTQQDVEGTS